MQARSVLAPCGSEGNKRRKERSTGKERLRRCHKDMTHRGGGSGTHSAHKANRSQQCLCLRGIRLIVKGVVAHVYNPIGPELELGGCVSSKQAWILQELYVKVWGGVTQRPSNDSSEHSTECTDPIPSVIKQNSREVLG